MSLRWILDDGPLDSLAVIVGGVVPAGWSPGVLWVSNTTFDAGFRHPGHRASFLSQTNAAGVPLVNRFSIPIDPDHPSCQELNELHPTEESTIDRAEHECIAWALTEDLEAVFVCQDKRASLTALAELGRGRVAHPFDLWLDLLDRGWIDALRFENLCRSTSTRDQGLSRIPPRVARYFPRSG